MISLKRTRNIFRNSNKYPEVKRLKKLIINADDFGLTDGCNYGIIYAMKLGVVTSTSIMINMPKASDAIKLAKDNGIEGIGLHLTLTCGEPVSPKEEVPSLINKRGYFYKRRAELFPVMNLNEAEKELRNQILEFKKYDIKLSHLDSHHHIHMYDGVREIVANLAKEYNLPLRQPNLETKELLIELGVQTTDSFSMGFYDEKANINELIDIIDQIPDGSIEIMTHPAIVDRELYDYSSYNKQRLDELKVLTSKELKDWIEANNIKLITYGDLGTA